MSDTDPVEHGFEEGYEETAEIVRAALNDRTAEVDVKPDAYAQLAAKVVDAGRVQPRRGFGLGRPLAAGLAGMVVLVGAVAVGTRLVNSDPGVLVADGPLAADSENGGDAANFQVVGDGEAGSAAGISPSSTVPDGGPIDNGDPALGLGPIRASKIEAAEAFLPLITDEPTEVVELNGEVVVFATPEGAPEAERPISTLEVIEVSTGWAVRSAASPLVTIDEPVQGATVGSTPMTLSGTGTGFEGTVVFEVRSAVDGSLLLQTSTLAGSLGTPEPFELTLDLLGTDRVWLIAHSSGAADGVATSFTARPITLDGRANPAPYVVFGVALDDPDGGLNVRSGPGAVSEKVAVLEWGQIIRRTPGLFPISVGDDIWWPIEDEFGTSGWVNARYLAGLPSSDGAVSIEQATSFAESFLMVAAQPDLAGWYLVGADRSGFTVVVDGDMINVDPAQLERALGWTAKLGDKPSLAALVSAPSSDDGPVEFVLDQGEFVDEAMAEVAERFFGGLPSVTATYTGADGETHATHLFIEQSPTGLRCVGVILEVWN